MVRRQAICFLFLSALICVFLNPAISAYAAVEPGEFTDGLLREYRTAFSNLEDRMIQAARGIFAALFLCQFAWAIIQICLQESLTFGAVIATIIRQFIMGGFFWWLLTQRWITKSIVESFEQLASSGLKVSELLFIMATTIEGLMRAVGENTGMTISGLALFLSGLCASLVMSYAMTVAISYLAIVMLENFIVSSVGLILLGFGGSEYTRNYALSYVKTLFHIGFKLFLATVIIQIGVRAFRMATTGVGSADDDAIIQICMNKLHLIYIISMMLLKGVSLY